MNKMLLLLLLTTCNFLYAQSINGDKEIIIKNGAELYKQIYDAAYKHTDSLSQVPGKGNLYIRFTVEANGMVKDIVASQKEPAILVSSIRQILENKQLLLQKSTVKNDSYFILPVQYDYFGQAKIDEIIDKLPKLDLEKLATEQPVDNFATFFNINSSKTAGVIGVSCIFLPWINLRGKIE